MHLIHLFLLRFKAHIKYSHVDPVFTRFLFLCRDNDNDGSRDENKTLAVRNNGNHVKISDGTLG